MYKSKKKIVSSCLVATLAITAVTPQGIGRAKDTNAQMLKQVTQEANLTAHEGAYGYYVDNSGTNQNDAAHMSVASNASIGLLSEYLELWTPGSEWYNGSKKNATVLNENINKAYEIAAERTVAQSQAAYDDEFNNQNYSMLSGLEEYEDDFIKGTGLTEDKKSWSPVAESELYDVADLIDLMRNRTAASTNSSKAYYKYPRPYRWNNETGEVVTTGFVESQVVPEIAIDKNLASKSASSDGGFPSGHTNAASISSYALAYAVPEKFDELIMRAADLGNNRIVAGMHSPLDVMGGHMTSKAVAASAIYNDTEVTKKAYETAQEKLTKDFEIKTATAEAYAEYKENAALYKHYLTYDFEQINDKNLEMKVPKGAEGLLETRLPYLSDEERRYVIYTTGLESGYPLLDDAEGWGRVNLYTASNGYGALLKDTTITMDASKGGYHAKDNWMNDITGTGALTKAGTGELVLAGANSFSGGTTVNEGSITITNKSAFGTGSVTNNSTINEEVVGTLDVADDYIQGENATLKLTVDSALDILNIADAAKFDGNLEITFAEGYTPAANTKIITAKSVSGTFDKVTIKGTEGKEVLYTADVVSIVDEGTANSPSPSTGSSTEDDASPSPSADTSIAPTVKPSAPAKIDINTASITGINDVTATGSDITLPIVVTIGGKVLVAGTDYTVKYEGNRNPGAASIIITGTGNYTGVIIRNFTIFARKNASYTVSGTKYKVNSAKKDGKGTVQISSVNKKCTSIVVKDAVKIGGVSYKVTGIANNAFKNSTKLKKVTLGKNITSIGKNAFAGCKKLKTIVIKSTKLKANSIGNKAFAGVAAKAKIDVPNSKVKVYKKILLKKGVKKTAKIK